MKALNEIPATEAARRIRSSCAWNGLQDANRWGPVFTLIRWRLTRQPGVATAGRSRVRSRAFRLPSRTSSTPRACRLGRADLPGRRHRSGQAGGHRTRLPRPRTHARGIVRRVGRGAQTAASAAASARRQAAAGWVSSASAPSPIRRTVSEFSAAACRCTAHESRPGERPRRTNAGTGTGGLGLCRTPHWDAAPLESREAVLSFAATGIG